ncbi:hypothetical protein C8R43DRAFT_1186383 [Mycena crocata]|nr:hypothetical protein C8R43DRAFT_1186383 [Mycena crocata]
MLFTILLALALVFVVFARYRASKKTTPLMERGDETSDEDSSVLAAENLPLKETTATVSDRKVATTTENGDMDIVPPADDSENIQIVRHGDREVQHVVLPVDTTTDITPHERRMMDVMDSAGSGEFQYIRQLASKFEEAVQAGNIAGQNQIRLSVGSVCSFVQCGKPCLNASGDKWVPKRCMGCLSNLYCSKECQQADWKPILGKPKRKSAYHKDWCKIIKNEYMPQLPYFQRELLQFPWGRIERDGTFSHKFLLARFGVLDADYRKVGFWTVPERLNPHDVTDDPLYNAGLQKHASMLSTNPRGYAHGQIMLAHEEWPSDIDVNGWKLQDEALIPHFFFTSAFPGRVQANHVLTTYHLLTDTLKVVDPHRTSRQTQVVDVNYLGAETELNYLPLFSELALLLPNTHINLTVFSPATHALLTRAKQRSPRSIAAREGPVWEYTAPRTTGGGSIAISLYHPPPRPPMLRSHPAFKGAWDRSVMMLAPKDPDALIALNAGILSYSTWFEVVPCATMTNIPFACTDYAQQSVKECVGCVPEWLTDAAPRFRDNPDLYHQLVRERGRPITVNPFHRPGQRPIPMVRSPNVGNGFIARLV